MDFATVHITCNEILRDILIAELDQLGFSAFQETSEGLTASIESPNWNESSFLEIIDQYQNLGPIEHRVEMVAKINWNAEWEKNFDPVVIDSRCVVRAPFHVLDQKFDHEILVIPKMSFGTGHHATTSQMLALQLDLDHRDKSVLDVGTGTGVLAIMALKLGASHVQASDIDDWCIENSLENLSLNGYSDVEVMLGEIRSLTFDQTFDILLANINKNVLLSEMSIYGSLLAPQGSLLLSGFYDQDVSDIEHEASKYGLITVKKTVKDNWAALQFNRVDQ